MNDILQLMSDNNDQSAVGMNKILSSYFDKFELGLNLIYLPGYPIYSTYNIQVKITEWRLVEMEGIFFSYG